MNPLLLGSMSFLKSSPRKKVEGVFKRLFLQDSVSNLFLKDMAYQIPLNKDFVSTIPKGTKILFLVREPSQSIMSYLKEYLKDGVETDFTKPEFTMDYEKLRKL